MRPAEQRAAVHPLAVVRPEVEHVVEEHRVEAHPVPAREPRVANLDAVPRIIFPEIIPTRIPRPETIPAILARIRISLLSRGRIKRSPIFW